MIWWYSIYCYIPVVQQSRLLLHAEVYCGHVFTEVLRTWGRHVLMCWYLKNDSLGGDRKNDVSSLRPRRGSAVHKQRLLCDAVEGRTRYLMQQPIDPPESCMCVTFSHGINLISTCLPVCCHLYVQHMSETEAWRPSLISHHHFSAFWECRSSSHLHVSRTVHCSWLVT